MYKQVTRYQTADGKEFKTAKEAEKHIEALICDRITQVIKQAAPDIKHKDATNITAAIYDNSVLISGLLAMLDYTDEDQEPQQCKR